MLKIITIIMTIIAPITTTATRKKQQQHQISPQLYMRQKHQEKQQQ